MSLGIYYCLCTYVDGISAGISGAVTSRHCYNDYRYSDWVSGTEIVVTTPSLIQIGMTECCNIFYQGVSGDGFDDFCDDRYTTPHPWA